MSVSETALRPAQTAPADKIPVILLTGFLGAGKTTLLNRLLKLPETARTGLIINEFGAAGIDDRLVETADESIVELMNGCLCCTIKGDLPDTIAAMLARGSGRQAKRKNEQNTLSGGLNRLIIETTGLADPAPILQALLGTPFLQPYLRLAAVITLADSTIAAETLSRSAEARRQIAFADTIILSKTDLAQDKTAEAALRRQIKQLNSHAEILIPPPAGSAAAEADFCRALLSPEQSAAKITSENKPHNHAAHQHNIEHEQNDADSAAIYSFTLSAAEPLPLAAAEHFMYLLAERFGSKILRLKGIIDTGTGAQASGGRYYSLQAVQGRVFPPQIYRPRPGSAAATAEIKTEITVIAAGADEEEIRRLFAACLNRPAADTADYAALTDNPLAIAGMKF